MTASGPDWVESLDRSRKLPNNRLDLERCVQDNPISSSYTSTFFSNDNTHLHLHLPASFESLIRTMPFTMSWIVITFAGTSHAISAVATGSPVNDCFARSSLPVFIDIVHYHSSRVSQAGLPVNSLAIINIVIVDGTSMIQHQKRHLFLFGVRLVDQPVVTLAVSPRPFEPSFQG